MNPNKRVLSIDIMRGLTLFLMLFVNDLYTPGVPKWMLHTSAMEDGMGLADWVFPGFLFMVGMSIPFAFRKRIAAGESYSRLIRHILLRTISLLIIGVFMVNFSSYNEEACLLNKYVWIILVYICFFLVWNSYPKHSDKTRLYQFLKICGIVGLLCLAFLFRSGEAGEIGWMETKWWGILGLIGWGYLVAVLSYLFARDRLPYLFCIFLLFVGLNILSQGQSLSFLNPLKPVFGVIIDGNVPSIVISGLLMGLILNRFKDRTRQLMLIFISLGLGFIILGFFLRNYFIISKILGTPSWAFICNGISILVFASLFFILDIKRIQAWSKPFLSAGKNSLTCYLAPNIIYYIIWGFGLNILFYKQDEIMMLAVLGSLIWALSMVGFTAFLASINIRLKL